MAGDGKNPFKGNTIKSKRDENIYTDSPLIQDLLQLAKKFETERYMLTRADVIRDHKVGDFAIYDKQGEKKYYFIRKDIRILTDEGNDGRYLISSPIPITAMQVDDELEGFLREIAPHLKLELKTEQMVTHSAYKSPLGVNCIFRKRTEDRFLPSLLDGDLEKIEERRSEYHNDFSRSIPDWQASCWAWDEARGMRIKCQGGALLFNYMADRVGFLTNDNKVAWTVKTGKYDLIIRNFEKYSHDTRPLEEAAFWMLK